MSTADQTTQVVVESQDDNKLVTRKDLENPKNLWSDSERLSKLQQEMQLLSKVRIPVETFPDAVLLKAMGEVLGELGWDSYAKFSQTVRTILTNPRTVPFAVRTRNQRTGKMDFWLIRVFIKINDDYEVDGKKFNKLDVLMSRSFGNYLRSFCKEVLRDEAQFWCFTGSYSGKQHLDMSKLNQFDLTALENCVGETNPDNLIMFQLKKHVPEVYVGRNGTKYESTNEHKAGRALDVAWVNPTKSKNDKNPNHESTNECKHTTVNSFPAGT